MGRFLTWLGKHDVALQETLSILPSWPLFERCRAVYYRRALRTCGPELDVGQHVIVKFPSRLSVGRNVFINRGVSITARADITIGDNVSIGPFAIINSGDHRYQDSVTPIRRQGHELRPIVIHEDVWIGAHAVILKGAVLGRGCVVGAGAVVTGEVPPNQVVAGVPARPINERAEVVAAAGLA